MTLTTSPHLCPSNLTCLLPLDFASARYQFACSLPRLPLRRLVPHSELGLCSPTRLPDFRLFGPLDIGNKVLNCSVLDLSCSWVCSNTRYTDTSAVNFRNHKKFVGKKK